MSGALTEPRTEVDVDTESAPACENSLHNTDAPAEFVLRIHDCLSELNCRGCWERERSTGQKVLQIYGKVACNHCHRNFTSLDEIAWVVPL